MKHLNLTANNTSEQRVKEYLEQNVSDLLAEKINNGVQITKDGKTLINKKTLDGFMSYATEEARKVAEKGARSACIDDSTVFGWAIHYFEEDSIEGTLYNEDGTKYEKQKPTKNTAPKKPPQTAPKPTTEPKAEIPKQQPTPTPKPTQKQSTKPTDTDQISLFDLF